MQIHAFSFTSNNSQELTYRAVFFENQLTRSLAYNMPSRIGINGPKLERNAVGCKTIVARHPLYHDGSQWSIAETLQKIVVSKFVKRHGTCSLL